MELHDVKGEIVESLNKSEESLNKCHTGRSAQNTDKHL